MINRAATFVFMIDDRFFGTITAFVPGPDAAHYQFTSSLPVRVLGVLLPELEPLLQHPEAPRVRTAIAVSSHGVNAVADQARPAHQWICVVFPGSRRRPARFRHDIP